ncbi:MAG: M6 family metalloprotease-like protein [Myxococcota bacterium]|jgi:M6 family metalloprotease-like protein
MLLVVWLLGGALAMPGPPGARTVLQPDGSPVEVRFVGDCQNPRVEDARGFSLFGLSTDDGTRWEYADRVDDRLVPTGWAAGTVDPDTLGLVPHLAAEWRAPVLPDPATVPSGRRAALYPEGRHLRPLVVLVEFPGGTPRGVPDRRYGPEQFAAILFEDGLNPAVSGLPGVYRTSMRDYFDEISHGQFLLEASGADVYGWVEAPQTYDYYVDDQKGLGAFPRDSGGLMHDIVTQLDDTIDYSQYDGDGDGRVDHVILIVEGWGDGANDQFWPHQGSESGLELDGVEFSTYLVVNEQAAWDDDAGVDAGDPHPVSTFAHELGHILGLPDLYDTDYSSAGVGQWDLMGAGSYYSVVRPPALGAWSRVRLGWEEPEEAPAGASVADLVSVSDGGGSLRIWTDPYRSREYFLVENRQRAGIDAELASGGGGLIVWRIDDARGDDYPRFNTVNTDDDHYAVGVVQADGDDDLERDRNRGDGGDPFPGSDGLRSLTPSGYPNTASASGRETGVSLTNIAASQPIMSVDVSAPDLLGHTLAYDAFVSEWSAYWGDNYLRVRFTATEHGLVQAVRVWSNERNMPYTLWVHGSDDGEPGVALHESAGILGEGWVDVPVDPPVMHAADTDLYIKLRLDSDGFPIVYDGTSENDRRSYYSADDVDYRALSGDANVRLLLATAIDYDGDGFEVRDGDCDDTRADIFPGGVEVCNGLDDDCDGTLTPEDAMDLDDDGVPDCIDDDRDGDGVDNSADPDPDDGVACGDSDGDGCDDCALGTVDPADDGVDTDGDGVCDVGDDDDDGDTVADGDDPDPLDASVCGDEDADDCDDCRRSEGPPAPADDGPDADADGVCDKSDDCDGPGRVVDADGDGVCDDLAPVDTGLGGVGADAKGGCGCDAGAGGEGLWSLGLNALRRR